MLVHPAIAESCASAIDGVVSDPDVRGRLAAAAVEGPELLGRFAGISDGRSRRNGITLLLVALTLRAAAALAGMRSFTAIAGWVADVPAELLAWLYATPPSGGPSKTTLWRFLTGVDAAAVDAAYRLLAGRAGTTRHGRRCRPSTAARPPDTDPTDGADGELLAIAVDGKTVRGAVATYGAQVHLMAAATHGDQLVLGQVDVSAKTNEIPMFAPLIDQLAATGIDPAGWA